MEAQTPDSKRHSILGIVSLAIIPFFCLFIVTISYLYLNNIVYVPAWLAILGTVGSPMVSMAIAGLAFFQRDANHIFAKISLILNAVIVLLFCMGVCAIFGLLIWFSSGQA